jgi:hypothetical protein
MVTCELLLAGELGQKPTHLTVYHFLDCDPQVGDVIRLDGTEYTVKQRVWVGGGLSVVVSAVWPKRL